MQLNLGGKRALVTGSSRGIGFTIAAALQCEGCSVVLNGRDKTQLDEAATALAKSPAVAGDVTDEAGAQAVVDAAVDMLGGLDILVCNVGSGLSVLPGEETLAEWQRVFSINLWSTTNIVAAGRAALAESGGVVLCISSICGREVIPGAPVTYSAAKSALNAFVRGIARPLGQDRIRINALAPGNILFDGSVWDRKKQEDPVGLQAMLSERVVLGRLGTAEEVAALAAFMVSDKCSFATGTVWDLDGGQIRS